MPCARLHWPFCQLLIACKYIVLYHIKLFWAVSAFKVIYCGYVSCAFDWISRDKLWVTMMDMGYPLHLIDFLAILYRKQLTKVKVAGTLSEWFRVKKGVRQGCVLSLYLFNILAEMVMRETLDGFQGGLQIGGRILTNIRYTDDIILLATSEAGLQELVDHLDRVSRKYSLLINVNKTKVMANNGIACCMLIRNEQLEQVDMFPYLWSLITEDGECTTEFCTSLYRGRRSGHHCREYGNVTAYRFQ